jgi:YD repeat-containing protein
MHEGNLKTIAQGSDVTTLDYDENNRRKTLTYPNGIVASYGYDDAGRLTSLAYQKDQTVIESLSYTYDANGNIINRVRAGAVAKQEGAKTATYDPLTNRLTGLNSESFQYDDNGNMVSRINSCGTNTYTWNTKNELTAISGFKSDCSPLSASFAYDALGRRTQASVNGDTTTYLYDGMNVIAEIGVMNAHYLRTDNIDEAIARYSSQADRYFLTDLLGSTQVLTDRQGNSTTTYSYSPFGKTEASVLMCSQN